MRALVWTGPGTQTLQEIPEPDARDDEVLIRPALVGICGSDVTAHKGLMGISRPGAIRGHEFGGRLLTDTPGMPVGTRVAVNPVVPCGECRACTAREHTHCTGIRIIGVHLPGALADTVAVPRAQVHPIPDDMPWTDAAAVEPLANAVHMASLALDRARAPERVLVIGAGSVGTQILRVLRARGIPEVDVVEPRAARHDLVRGAGARTIHADADDADRAGYDAVLDVVGAASTRAGAVRACANGGVIVMVGLDENQSAIAWHDVVRRELTIIGAQAFGPRDYEIALRELASGDVVHDEPFRVVLLHSGPALFDELTRRRDAFGGKTFIQVSD